MIKLSCSLGIEKDRGKTISGKSADSWPVWVIEGGLLTVCGSYVIGNWYRALQDLDGKCYGNGLLLP